MVPYPEDSQTEQWGDGFMGGLHWRGGFPVFPFPNASVSLSKMHCQKYCSFWGAEASLTSPLLLSYLHSWSLSRRPWAGRFQYHAVCPELRSCLWKSTEMCLVCCCRALCLRRSCVPCLWHYLSREDVSFGSTYGICWRRTHICIYCVHCIVSKCHNSGSVHIL